MPSKTLVRKRPFSYAVLVTLVLNYHRRWPALILFVILSSRLAAQNVLLAEYKGKFLPVVRVTDNQPYVLVKDKQVPANDRSLALKKIEEYFPAFIAVHDLDFTSVFNLDRRDLNTYHEMILRAKFDSPYALEDVFMALETDTKTEGRKLFLHGLGAFKPNVPRVISFRVPRTAALSEGKFEMHLFAQGDEVLHSELPQVDRDTAVDRMTEKRIATIKDAAPQLFIGPMPEYPAALIKTRSNGQAMISVRIGANGRVYDSKVQSASEPAFGEAALAAVRWWRFLPQIRNGQPVETFATLPVLFDSSSAAK